MRYLLLIFLTVFVASCSSMSRKINLEDNGLKKLQSATPIGTGLDEVYKVASDKKWRIVSDSVQNVWSGMKSDIDIERELILDLGWRPGIPFSFNVYAHIGIGYGKVFDYYVNAEVNAL